VLNYIYRNIADVTSLADKSVGFYVDSHLRKTS